MDTLKVLLVGYKPPPVGGVTILFNQLVKELDKIGEIDTEVVDISMEKSGTLKKLIHYVETMFRIVKKLKCIDVLSFHATTTSAILMGPALLAISNIVGVPFVFRKFGGSFDRYYRESGIFKKSIIFFLVSGSDVALFETKELVNFFRPMPNSDVRWYPNSRPKKKSTESSEQAKSFVFISQIKSQKGVVEICKAANHVDDSITVDLFGPRGYDISQADIQRLIENTRATYHGPVEPEQVICTLQKYDCLVLPTYWPHEGYPGVIIEAYMAGLPVITTQAGAIPEIVDEESGLFVNERDARDLASEMSRLHRDPELYKRLRRGAEKKASSLNSERWSRTFENICKEVV